VRDIYHHIYQICEIYISHFVKSVLYSNRREQGLNLRTSVLLNYAHDIMFSLLKRKSAVLNAVGFLFLFFRLFLNTSHIFTAGKRPRQKRSLLDNSFGCRSAPTALAPPCLSLFFPRQKRIYLTFIRL
jgi:hypothetical protein